VSSTKEGARARRNRTRAAITTVAALGAAAAFAVPAQAAVTTPGASIEVFHGRDFVGLNGYPKKDLRVEVHNAAGDTLAFVDVKPADDPRSGTLVEINHVGDLGNGTTDCFNGGTAPDIIPGDTIVVTDGVGGTINDSSEVQNIQFPTSPDPSFAVDPVAHTITVTGFAKSPADAALDNVEIRLNHPSGTWDAPGAGGRKDWRVPGTIDALGNFTAVFEAASDNDLVNVESAGIAAEWGNANLSELTIFDGIGLTCPRDAAGDRPIVTPPAFVPPARPAPGAGGGTTSTPSVITRTVVQTVPGVGATTPSPVVLGARASSLSVSRLTLARRISVTHLRARGLRVSMRVQQGTNVLRFAIYKAKGGAKTGRALYRTSRTPSRAGLFRTTLRSSKLSRLKAGRYVMEVRAGRDAASLGAVKKIAFTVTK
jgi:hypothetical protein